MKKLTKGALTMVLVGSVTFSVTNAMFGGKPLKQLAQAIDSTQAGDNLNQVEKKKNDQTKKAVHHGSMKKNTPQVQTSTPTPTLLIADNRNQAGQTEKLQPTKIVNNIKPVENTVKNQTPKNDVKVVHITPSKQSTAKKAVLTNGNKSDQATAVIQKKTTSNSKTSTTPHTTRSTTNPVRNPKSTTKGAGYSKASGTSNTNTIANTAQSTSTLTNHGQEVSQAAKEKAVTHQVNKENNGKKK